MNDAAEHASEWSLDAWSLGTLLAFAAGLALALAGVRALVGVLPLSQAQRSLLARVLPVVELSVMGVYAAVTVPALFGTGTVASAAAALVLAAVLLASWGPLRDVVSGVVVKAGGALHVGDTVSVGGVEGSVRRIGLRVLELETGEGAEALVPFSEVARHPVVRTPKVAGSYRHRFSVPGPPEERVGEAKQLIREVALLSHWSQVARDPEIHFGDSGTLEVQVFPIDPGRGPDVEASVRAALTRSGLLVERRPDGREA